MGRKIEHSTSYNVSFNLRDKNSGDDVKVVNMNWENRSNEEIQQNINTWLTAIGIPLEVVKKDGEQK